MQIWGKYGKPPQWRLLEGQFDKTAKIIILTVQTRRRGKVHWKNART